MKRENLLQIQITKTKLMELTFYKALFKRMNRIWSNLSAEKSKFKKRKKGKICTIRQREKPSKDFSNLLKTKE